MRLSPSLALSALVLPAPAFAAGGTVTVELPRIAEGTYRKPYVAVWVEHDAIGREETGKVQVAAVLHDQARIGLRWLPELRSWWRKAGRGMDMPADGLSRPTRGPGRHRIDLPDLPDGHYALHVEAVREKGGREALKLPFEVRKGRATRAVSRGGRELGEISLAPSS